MCFQWRQRGRGVWKGGSWWRWRNCFGQWRQSFQPMEQVWGSAPSCCCPCGWVKSAWPSLTPTISSEMYFSRVWVELIFLVSFQRTLKCQRRKLRASIALRGLGWPRPNESTTRHLQRSSVTHSSRLCQPPPNTWRRASEFSEDANLWLGC